MSAIAFLRDLLADGVPLDAALIAADRFERRAMDAEVARITARRAKDAERQSRKRHAESRGVTRTDAESREPLPHVGERTQVVTPSLPSLRSEELRSKNTPTEPNGSVAPKGAKRGSKRVPENWSPSEKTLSTLTAEGHDAGAIERALTMMRDHEYRVARSDWDAALRNWIRNSDDRNPRKASHDRPSPNAKLDAKQANYARAWTGSERAVGWGREP